MRLTLRTMLAYMDDILEPNDAEDIRKKMEDSKFASELAQRIRDCVRNLRLPAPSLQGRGLGLDANSVAKYLDNELPAERVADFEKICLESDKHLAEVAACHQILTLVLGEPADVDPGARERMYGLLDLADAVGPAPEAPPTQAPPKAPPLGGDGASLGAAGGDRLPLSDERTVAAAAVDAARPGKRPKLEVPDYLREKRASRLWPVAAVMLVAFVLTAGIFALIAPPELRQQASGWLQNSPSDESSRDKAAGEPNAGGAAGQAPQGEAASETPPVAAPVEKAPMEGAATSGDGTAPPSVADGQAATPAASVTPAGAVPPTSEVGELAPPGIAPPVAEATNPAMSPAGSAPAGPIVASPLNPAASPINPGVAPLNPAGMAPTLPSETPVAGGGPAPPSLGPGAAGGAPGGPTAMPDAVASVTPVAPLALARVGQLAVGPLAVGWAKRRAGARRRLGMSAKRSAATRRSKMCC